jgi:hypothetical protein
MITMERKLHKPYTDWCDECMVEMTHRSKDGTQIFCTNCWVPKPVPHKFLSNNARAFERERLRNVAERSGFESMSRADD